VSRKYTPEEIAYKVLESIKELAKASSRRHKASKKVIEDLEDADMEAEVDPEELPVREESILHKEAAADPNKEKYLNRRQRKMDKKGVKKPADYSGINDKRSVTRKKYMKLASKPNLPKSEQPMEETQKSNYGPKGMGLYSQPDNERRKNSKKGNVGDIESGYAKIKMKTGANASGGQGKRSLSDEMRKLKAKNKKQPVKNVELSDEEKKKIEDRANKKNKLKDFMKKVEHKRKGS